MRYNAEIVNEVNTMPFKRVSPDRIDFYGSLYSSEVDEIANDPLVSVLQASSTINHETWSLLNQELFSRRTDITLRLYGFYSSVCDLSFLPHLPNLRRFSADCLRQAKHVESVASLPNLQALTIGIYELDTFEFLRDIQSNNITELALSETKSKKPRLTSLARFPKLRSLYLEGQQKDIQAISQLHTLEELTLRSITVPELEFLRGLMHLWSLDIKLGGTNNLGSLEGMLGLKYLELWQIRGLHDISVVSKLRGLQFLFLQSLPHITAIPDLTSLTALRRVYLENMKGLKNLSGLENVPALDEFIHVDAQGMEPSDYICLLKNKCIKRISVGFGSIKKNNILRDLTAQAGVDEYQGGKFVFV